MYWWCLSGVQWWVGGVVTDLWRWSWRWSCAETLCDWSCLLCILYWTFIVCRLVQVRSGISFPAAACKRNHSRWQTDLNAPPGFTWSMNILKQVVWVICRVCSVCVLSGGFLPLLSCEWQTEHRIQQCNWSITKVQVSPDPSATSDCGVCTARFFALTFRRDVIKELWEFFCDGMKLLKILQWSSSAVSVWLMMMTMCLNWKWKSFWQFCFEAGKISRCWAPDVHQMFCPVCGSSSQLTVMYKHSGRRSDR